MVQASNNVPLLGFTHIVSGNGCSRMEAIVRLEKNRSLKGGCNY